MSDLLAPARPSAKDEEWRYADFEAVDRLSPDTFEQWKEVELAPGETRRHSMIVGGDAPELHRIRLKVGAGARAELFVLISGNEYTRVECVVNLAEGAHFEFGGVTIGGGTATREFVTRLDHGAPDATSRQVVRSVHWGQATGSFLGRIDVGRDGQRTDAAQDFKGLLLERGATTNAKPELEIYADDVKCAHGAAIGQLDEQARYYYGEPRHPARDGQAAADPCLHRRCIHGPGRRGRAGAAVRSGPCDPGRAAVMEDNPTLAGSRRGTAAESGDGSTAPAFDLDHSDMQQLPFGQSADDLSPRSGEDRKADFPGLVTASGKPWHYLDTAATSQKPQVVIDAVTRAIGVDYATVHRGVYGRSADMTLGYEAARQRVAEFIGGREDEIVFTRGATEAINLVAYTWCAVNLGKDDRILLSELEHHSNIVPWQILQQRLGFAIDICPLTDDGRIDLDAAERRLNEQHKLVAFAHVSNVLGFVLDGRRAADLAHAVGAKLLLDGCQAVPRLTVDVAELDCDFYAFSGHKLYGPTGIGALWARAEILAGMPPWQGGGAMIDKVDFAGTTFAPPPQRFEAGTPAIVEAIGLAVACDYVSRIGLDTIHAHESELVAQTREALGAMNDVRLFGPADSAGIVSFVIDGIHPHDLGTILDEEGVAIRAGHHCAQPLMARLGVDATARASFGLYSDEEDVAALIRGIERTKRIFG